MASQTSQPSRSRTRRPYAGRALHRTLAGAATAALTLGVLAGCGEDSDRAEDPAPASGTSSATAEPSASAGEPTTSSEPSQSAEPDPGETSTVPVYYVGDSPMGPRLYREFRRVSGDPGLGAADMVAAGVPADPDYRAAFPVDGSFSSVRLDEEAGLILVQVPDDRWADRPADMSGKQARLAVQALVYTVQGALQSRAPVQVVGEPGGPAVPLFGVDTDGGVANADQLDVLSLVSVTSPESDAEVSGTFTASGVASSFEATVPWEVRDSSGEVVVDGFATAEGWMDRLYPWESEVDVSGLAPGEYTFVAMTDDPSGGAEGPGAFEDSKVISVG
ncbi:hypothetical protein NOK12_25870 [Nocardioides sp. OK12]|nr:hypothetical protein NOK12_25870 [Nocardioides sp. OK12]